MTSRAFRCILKISLVKRKEIFNVNNGKSVHLEHVNDVEELSEEENDAET